MKNLLHYFEGRLYKFTIWLLVNFLIRHDKRWGAKHLDNLRATTTTQADGRKYWFECRAFIADDLWSELK